MERESSILGYIFKSIGRAIDFMVDRAWFDLVSLSAAVVIPDIGSVSHTGQRVVFVLLFTLILFGIRESLSKVHKDKS